jgi:hypothetical protein
MRFDPLRLLPHPAVFVVKPARVSGCAEAGRVHSKSTSTLASASCSADEFKQDRCQLSSPR